MAVPTTAVTSGVKRGPESPAVNVIPRSNVIIALDPVIAIGTPAPITEVP